MLRATNTGISALIDPFGRIPARLETNRRGVLDVRLPAPLPPTFFSRRGDLPAFCAGALLLLLSAWLAVRARSRWRARNPR